MRSAPIQPGETDSANGAVRHPGWITLPCLGLACLSATAATPPTPAPPAAVPTSPWTPSITLSVREEYDTNIHLQDLTPFGRHESWVTTTIPNLGIKYAGPEGLRASASYAPEFAFFHAEPDEDFILHRMALSAGGRVESTEWDLQNQLVVIDGDELGPIFTGPGGAPAAGGPRIRDRRDATIYRGTWKVTHPVGRWLIRPVVTGYLHDFQTRQLRQAGYMNYADRNEYTGGVDLGTTVSKGTRLFLGYRFGVQDESHLLDFPEEYDNRFHRMLVSLEGTPWSWAKAAITLGPEFRTYGDLVPAGFGDHDVQNLFVDASVTLTLGRAGSLTASVKLFEQPGFAGRAAYEDLTYDLTWRCKLAAKTSLVLNGRAYNTDFLAPALRNDWVLTGAATVAHEFSHHWQAEMSYTHEDGQSFVPATTGRDYVREVVALGVRYTFR